jgi:hypothetical protein
VVEISLLGSERARVGNRPGYSTVSGLLGHVGVRARAVGKRHRESYRERCGELVTPSADGVRRGPLPGGSPTDGVAHKTSIASGSHLTILSSK